MSIPDAQPPRTQSPNMAYLEKEASEGARFFRYAALPFVAFCVLVFLVWRGCDHDRRINDVHRRLDAIGAPR